MAMSPTWSLPGTVLGTLPATPNVATTTPAVVEEPFFTYAYVEPLNKNAAIKVVKIQLLTEADLDKATGNELNEMHGRIGRYFASFPFGQNPHQSRRNTNQSGENPEIFMFSRQINREIESFTKNSNDVEIYKPVTILGQKQVPFHFKNIFWKKLTSTDQQTLDDEIEDRIQKRDAEEKLQKIRLMQKLKNVRKIIKTVNAYV